MDSSKSLFDVQIAGLPLKLRSSHDEATVKELAALVDGKVEEALKNQGISFQNAILLAALHVAEELVLLRRMTHDELGTIQKRAQQVLNDLESSPITQMRLNC